MPKRPATSAPPSPDIPEIVRRLRKTYGPLRAPRAEDPLVELVWTILSQHTSDANAERAFHALRAAFPTWEAVLAAREAAVADAIRSGGLANVKAARIRAVLREILDRRGALDLAFLAELSDAEVMEFLTTLPGVGPKTAAIVLAFALGRQAIPVDTHVHRVATRLGLVPKTDAVRAQRLLEASVPHRSKTAFHMGLIAHGRQTCTAQRPKCSGCLLLDLCPTGAVEVARVSVPARRRVGRTARS